MSNEPIIAPICARCQRRNEILNAYAATVVAADLRMQDLEAERDTLRMLAATALETVVRITQQNNRLREAARTMRDELVYLRERAA